MDNEFNFKINAKTVGIFGLIINSLGAIISAVSFIGGDGRITSQTSGIEYRIAHISELGFKTGLLLLILGFVLQILEKTSKEEGVGIVAIILSIIITTIIYLDTTIFLTNFLFR